MIATLPPVRRQTGTTTGLRLFIAVLLVALGGCALRPVTPPLAKFDAGTGYRWINRPAQPDNDGEVFLILAFSGGGTRAAALSYGVLEELRRTPVGPAAKPHPMLTEVDMITGVSGGSFTALSYALHGEQLFGMYERDFLNRDVESELLRRLLNPFTWPSTLSAGFGRSELAAQYYDEILFHGATFADLINRPGPLAVVSATDISSGTRWDFTQANFDIICADMSALRLSRAAATSSAVPIVLSPVTYDNYAGSCGYHPPAWVVTAASQPRFRAWPGSRVQQRYEAMNAFGNRERRPYIHLVDGGLSGNLGLMNIVDWLQELGVDPRFRAAIAMGSYRHVAVVIVNAQSAPDYDFDQSERAPSALALLAQAINVPIDRYSYESVDALEDMVTDWSLRRQVERDQAKLGGTPAQTLPPIGFSVIDVSFAAVRDPAERKYLLNLPTSLYLPPEAIDRLRAAAGQVMRESMPYRDLVRVLGKRN